MARIAIIAGRGDHPLKLAQCLRQKGETPYVIILRGQADADFSDFEADSFPLGQIGKMISALKAAKCDRLVMAGKVSRPPLSLLKPDAIALKLMGSLLFLGDNAILERLKSHLGSEGIRVEDADTYMERSRLPVDYHFGNEMTAENLQDIELGVSAMHQMDGLDIGQGLVIQSRRILSVEGAEGTDALLMRTAALVDDDGTGAVFVKMSKPSQDKTQDAPSFGIQTLNAMAKSGIKIAAFEAEHSRALESLDAIEAEAESLGISIVSVRYRAVK